MYSLSQSSREQKHWKIDLLLRIVENIMRKIGNINIAYYVLFTLLFVIPSVIYCGANIFSTSRELSMGAEFAYEIENQVELLDDEEWAEYVNAIGQKIVSVCDRQDIDYKFTIVDDTSTVNAFALPGGYLYVYTGLLRMAENEAEVAGVLAHEVGHVVGKHSMKKLTSLYGYQFLLTLALGSNPGQMELLAGEILAGLGIVNYGRSNELESDDYAIKYLYALGYDPNGFVTFLEKLGQLRSSNPSFVEKIMSTHPEPSERIERARQAIALLPSKENLTIGKEEYLQRRAKLYNK